LDQAYYTIALFINRQAIWRFVIPKS
jgi:hypothetical protein